MLMGAGLAFAVGLRAGNDARGIQQPRASLPLL
jgi:hypothetical protein